MMKPPAKEAGAPACVSFPDQFTVVHTALRTGRTELKEFQMTRAFTPENTQEEVLHIVRIRSMLIMIGV